MNWISEILYHWQHPPVAKARTNIETPLKWTVILFQPAFSRVMLLARALATGGALG
jgi:hypothetical protein